MASLGSVVHKHGFSPHCHADDTQLYLSFHPDDPTIANRISACLADISCWMKDHHLQLNLAKTELLVVSANPSFHHNFTFHLGSSTITPSKTARNLGVVIDDKLNFTDHITKTCRSCRFALYNIKKIRPFLSEHVWRVGRGREPWERSEAGGVNDNERHLRHSPVLNPTEELRKE